MATQTWTLLDVDQGIAQQSFNLHPSDVKGPAPGVSVTLERLSGGLCDGVDVVEINNGACRFKVLPTRGMGIHRAWLGDLEIGWKSPVRGPVHPKFVPLWAANGVGWMDGFDELFVRCGLESNGPPIFADDGRLQFPLHGRIANQPAHRVELSIDPDEGEITLTGEVDESRLFHSKLRLTTTIKTRYDEPGFRVHDEIENLSSQPAELQLLYHINFGPPLLEPGAKIVLPLQTLVPQTSHAAQGVSQWDTYFEPEPGFEEHVFLMELAADAEGCTQALLRNASGEQGVSLHFNKRRLPLFTLWKSMQPEQDGYVTGLEPSINYPNPRPFEKAQGRVRQLEPGEVQAFEIGLEIHGNADEVANAEAAVSRLQATVTPTIYDQPTLPWTPAGK